MTSLPTGTVNLGDANEVVDLFERATAALRSSPLRRGCVVRLPARGRLLATGDLHDSPAHLEQVIRAARLGASPDHHVVLHEMIHGDRLVNGMDFSYRMLGRVAAHVVEHPGQVHPVLANHEIAQMTGKGVSKGAGNSVEMFKDAVEFAFGERATEVDDAIGDFIRAMALAVMSEDGVCCAHSLPGSAATKHFDPAVVDRALVEADFYGPAGPAYLMTWGRRYTREDVERLAEAWNVRLFVLGHERVDTGIEIRGPRVVILNTDHERATVLPIDLAAVPSAEEAMMYALPLAALG